MPEVATPIADFKDLILQWARCRDEVKRAWIFGSYAYGTPCPGSDLDVAIEISPSAIDHWGIFTFWMRHGSRLEEDLRNRFRAHWPMLEVNLELFHRYYGKIAYSAICQRRLAPVYRQPKSLDRSRSQ
ncbi:nucleotidyltransferase family protein [Diaphorobacter caeni]|uniref:nucleotidyltransferase family protein n=1 Tax=Diaphorobacter caeni TaxID=2784387 RepID=UPI0038992D79